MTLAARIRDGAYDGRSLPGERELAAQFGVARVTVRNALKRLESRGLVVRKHRSGTLPVSAPSASGNRQLLRDHLDQFLARGRRDKRSVIEFGEVSAKPAVADALGVEAGKPVLRIVRVRSRGAEPLAYTEVFVPQRISAGITRAALTRKAFVEILQDLGVEIGTAEQSISADAASATVHGALQLALDTPVLKLTRVIRDAAGVPVQFLLGWYRADRFEFRMRLSRVDDATRVWVESR
jgi:GntR family transcriptional regulator